jgi:hypothetical protein
MYRSLAAGFAIGFILASVAPLRAQISEETPAARLRVRPDPRLYVGTAPGFSPEMVMPRTASPVPEDSAYENYGLLGAVIGGVATGLAVSLYYCGYSENCDLGKAILFGTPLFGIPGFVVGGLIGASIKKPRPAEEEAAGRADDAHRAPDRKQPDPSLSECSNFLSSRRPGGCSARESLFVGPPILARVSDPD